MIRGYAAHRKKHGRGLLDMSGRLLCCDRGGAVITVSRVEVLGSAAASIVSGFGSR